MIRKATERDIEQIAGIYEAIHSEEENGRCSTGWTRGVYPTKQTAFDAVERSDMFVLEDGGQIMAAAIINQIQVPVYDEAKWVYSEAFDDEIMVLHTLVVSPFCSGKGYGTAFVEFYERYAADNDCKYLRMDTNEKNTVARRMYKRLGYVEADTVQCIFNGIEGVKLVCLEKQLRK